MNISDLSSVFDLAYAIGELLTTTWPGRIALGMAVGSVLTRIARS